MSHHRVCSLGVLGALTFVPACGEQGQPEAPVPPMFGGPGAPGAAPGSDAGTLPPPLVPTGLPADFLALPPAQVEYSQLAPYGRPAPSDPFSPPTQAVRATPAISGGTLALGASGVIVASDPDRDLIYVLDRALDRLDTLQLDAGQEPGRVAIHGERAFVALRAGGALLTVDLATRRVSTRLPLCAAPRGVSFDAVDERVLVACAGGDLVAVSSDGTRVLTRMHVAADLRDVGRDSEGVWVSQYRAARLLRLNAALAPARQQQPADVDGLGERSFKPTLAWRTVAGPSGEPFMLHQRSQSTMVGTALLNAGGGGAVSPPASNFSGAYGSGVPGQPPFCESGIVHTTVSRFGAPEVRAQLALPQAVVPVDLSLAPSGTLAAAVAPGNFVQHQAPRFGGPARQQLYLMESAQLAKNTVTPTPEDCLSNAQGWHLQFPGEATAVQFIDDQTLLVQIRNPAELDLVRIEPGSPARLERVISLSPLALRDTGHEVFHQNTGTGIACASCHGEALDDGHVWNFAGMGVRRTQHLRGGVLQTAPFHWSGDLATLDALINDVYQTRMGGAPLASGARDALAHWLGTLPRVPSEPGNAAQVERGRALFQSAQVGCATCHASENLRSDGRYDVGTGGSFEVPSLHGVSLRLPLMHNGCADTLEKRFDPGCGGATHGNTAQLEAQQLADLVAYLASL